MLQPFDDQGFGTGPALTRVCNMQAIGPITLLVGAGMPPGVRGVDMPVPDDALAQLGLNVVPCVGVPRVIHDL
jgi:hypothetical protein